ncbi:MAG: signal peptidase I [Paraglaciecola sp.]|jgi:signal peptidase I
MSTSRKHLLHNAKHLIRHNSGVILFAFFMFAARSSFADWYQVPTGSMLPTIVEGDRILVNKMAYHLELPFTDISLMKTGSPERGDIVVFNSQAADNRLVKRLIGLPGDEIAMRNNQLFINGTALEYENVDGYATEQLDKINHQLQFIVVAHPADNFAPVVVPKGHYLVLGDNRNNSSDSRFIGFVPSSELQGKAIKVLISLDADNYYLPRTERSFTPLV